MKLCRNVIIYFVYLNLLLILLTSAQRGQKKGRKGGGEGRKGKGERAGRTNARKLALEEYIASLVPELDYNASNWRYRFRSRSTTDYFNHYTTRLSKIFLKYHAEVNFAMVGACDGVTDPVIKFQFLKQPHWRGVFVEPMSINVIDLEKFIYDNNGSNRSVIIRAAATDVCQSPTIDVERPLYEEKAAKENKTVPHWLRRQIGSILPKNRNHARRDWVVETVACKTANDILRDWAIQMPVLRPDGKSSKSTRRRPHILKVDVEGHDFQVMNGFIGKDTPTSDLPLLVCFEAKSIAEKFPKLKQIMEDRGYVVSDFGQDGFALLKGANILPDIKRRSESEDSGDLDLTNNQDLLAEGI